MQPLQPLPYLDQGKRKIQLFWSEKWAKGRKSLSLKVAFIAVCFAVVLALIEAILGLWLPLWFILCINILLIGALAYFVAKYFLSRRIEYARSMLKQFRKRNFEGLKSEKVPHGDELDELLRQVYRIGFAMRTEIDRLKQVENYRREFLGDVSHELKTPIFAIQGFAETLADGALEDEEVNHHFLQKIVRNADRLNHLVNDLSTISRIETGEMKMNVVAFSLDDLLQEVVEEIEYVAQKTNIQLSLYVPQPLPLVQGDPERIQQVLVNLVENAVKYNQAGGKVEVSAKKISKSHVQVRIADNGVGIPAEDLARVTERFYRVDKSRSREQGGTGLGLAIVKHLLEAHHKTLHIESTHGKGSVFTFNVDVSG
jgi:two-component system phosphate regulon sensor histidine kinase PhoR